MSNTKKIKKARAIALNMEMDMEMDEGMETVRDMGMDNENKINLYVPEFLKTGVRCLLLIHRRKDGGRNRSDYHAVKRISMNSEDFENHLRELIAIKSKNPDIPYRIYSNVNSRNIDKAIFRFKHEILDNDLVDNDQKYRFYTDINNRFFGCLMKPQSRKQNYFLFDLDQGEDYNDDSDFCKIFRMIENHTKILCSKQTPNGFHLITEPFNYTKINIVPKTDALFLI